MSNETEAAFTEFTPEQTVEILNNPDRVDYFKSIRDEIDLLEADPLTRVVIVFSTATQVSDDSKHTKEKHRLLKNIGPVDAHEASKAMHQLINEELFELAKDRMAALGMDAELIDMIGQRIKDMRPGTRVTEEDLLSRT